MRTDSAGLRRPRFLASRVLINIAVSAVLVALLAWLVDLRSLGALLLSMNPLLVAVAIAAALADRALMIGKWYPLLRAQGVDVPLLRAARVYLAAGFASLVLPTSVGGDLFRAVALGRERKAVVEIAASIVMERLLGLAASGILAAVALAVALWSSVRLYFLLPWALAAMAASIAAVCLPLAPRLSIHVRRWFEAHPKSRWAQIGLKFGTAYGLYRHHVRKLLIVGVLSVVEQGFPILVFWILAHALDIAVSPAALIVAVPLSLFVARLPIAVAGIGVLEGALVSILGLFDVSTVAALSLALAGRVVEIATALPGAFFWTDLVKGPTPWRWRKTETTEGDPLQQRHNPDSSGTTRCRKSRRRGSTLDAS